MKKPTENRKRVRILIWCLVLLAVLAAAYLIVSHTKWSVNYPPASSSPTPSASSRPTALPSASSQATSSLTQCSTAHLSASLASANSAAGTGYETLTLTNTGNVACYVDGYPGISLLSASGSQLGQPATRDTVTAVGSITLEPMKSAYSNIGFPDPGNFPAGQCSSAAASMRIYPPNQTTSLLVATSEQYCPGFAVTALSDQLQ